MTMYHQVMGSDARSESSSSWCADDELWKPSKTVKSVSHTRTTSSVSQTSRVARPVAHGRTLSTAPRSSTLVNGKPLANEPISRPIASTSRITAASTKSRLAESALTKPSIQASSSTARNATIPSRRTTAQSTSTATKPSTTRATTVKPAPVRPVTSVVSRRPAAPSTARPLPARGTTPKAPVPEIVVRFKDDWANPLSDFQLQL